ncbi:hypothetical protein A3A52_05580 [Candidatus Woesebacteria bacterium RIFCSPLOWO2_01_FULL_39_14]|uniref:Uncharacterized protein n=1 Tax=Candidatus Woesebacteria bacterium RIFCSPLOWO2_01_FULL_39_14 TaxID=1802518 RepID=A0A1F8BDB1_9BACT|nr:MAG: hypothetical protein A3A52_05580 [Candidatus Woesebacteria bacterium RIFCSPLOWO2_01_FULL_39_14]
MSKRKRFIATSITLSLGFVGIQFLPEQYRIISIGLLGLLTLLLFFWSLKEGLGFNMTLITLTLPLIFTLGVGFFWFLLPTSPLTRIPIVIFYGFGIYALCLTANIYTVSAIRTIALLRAAKGVGFVLTLLSFFLVFDTILSLKWPIYLYAVTSILASFPLFFHGFWEVELEKNFSRKVGRFSLIASVIMGEIAIAIFFWPTSVVVGSLFLTVASYVLLGLGQAELEGRLFSQTIREYLLVGLAVFIGMFFVTRWGG